MFQQDSSNKLAKDYNNLSAWNEEEQAYYYRMKHNISRLYPKYDLSSHLNRFFSSIYNGTGLLGVSLEPYDDEKTYNCYDLNSAYLSTLLYERFPLSYNCFHYNSKGAEIDDILPYIKGKLYILRFEVIGMESKYKHLDYGPFNRFIRIKEHYKVQDKVYFCYELTMNNVDFETFLMLYKYEQLIVLDLYTFDKVDFMPDKLRLFLYQKYVEIKQVRKVNNELGKKYKRMLEILSYGKSAQLNDYLKDKYDIEVRHNRCIIATYQASYVRRNIAKLIMKYNEHVRYFDTDAIILDSKCKFEEKVSSKLGDFKEEFHEKKFIPIRSKSYLALNNNNTIYKYVFGGLKSRLSIENLNKLLKYKVIEVKEPRTIEGKIQWFDIELEWLYCFGTTKDITIAKKFDI